MTSTLENSICKRNPVKILLFDPCWWLTRPKVILKSFGVNFCTPVVFLKNGPFPASFMYFRLFNTQLTVNKCSIIFSRWLDSNRGPLVSEATPLPTEPHNLCPEIPRNTYLLATYYASLIKGQILSAKIAE